MGSVEYKARLEGLIRDLGLGDRVGIQIINSDEEVVRLMQRCSIFLFPSTVENFGLVALEAMACGKPIIVSNEGSLPEAVGNAGYVIECVPQKWAGVIDSLLADPSLRHDMGSRALDWARRFTLENTVDSLLGIFSRFT